jgi:starch synthase
MADVDDRGVALTHWGGVIEDYLDPLGVSLERFAAEAAGGWMFNYVEALRTAGVPSVILCVSRSVGRETRMTHEPSGAPLLALPPPRAYSALRRTTVGWRGGEPLGEARRRVVKTPGVRLGNYLATPVRAFGRALARERCAALVCQEYEYPRFDVCVLRGRAVGVPVFGSFQGSLGSGHPIERPLRKRAIASAAGLIVPSAAEERRLRERYGVAPARIARIPNPLDARGWAPTDARAARTELGLPADARVVAWHGRVRMREKGLDVLVEAWRRLRRECPEADERLVLVGGGDDAGQLRSALAAGGADGVHRVDGYQLDRGVLARHLSAADVYVLPSRQEGSPVALLEAMALGLPVVAADASGVADILPEGERSGGIVVPRDDPEALARALSDLLRDASSRSRRPGPR